MRIKLLFLSYCEHQLANYFSHWLIIDEKVIKYSENEFDFINKIKQKYDNKIMIK